MSKQKNNPNLTSNKIYQDDFDSRDLVVAIGMLTIGEVAKKLTVDKRTIARWVKNTDFPRPIKLSKRVVRWKESEINSWLQKRVNK